MSSAAAAAADNNNNNNNSSNDDSHTIVIAFSSDHATNTEQRRQVIAMLEADARGPAGERVRVLNLCPETDAAVDYPDYAALVCLAVIEGRAARGILLCGTGIGMSLAANKAKGVRAALCHDHLTARLAREHNDANVCCAGYRLLGSELLRDVLCTFVATPFSGDERHVERIGKITALEA